MKNLGLGMKPEDALWMIMTQDEEFMPAIEQGDDEEPEVHGNEK